MKEAKSPSALNERALGLMWDDIDWNSRQVYVRRTLQVGKFYDPKTKSSKRRIDVDPDLLLELKKWKLRCPKGKHNLVFPNEVGNPMDATNMIKRIWYPTLRRAGLRDSTYWGTSTPT